MQQCALLNSYVGFIQMLKNGTERTEVVVLLFEDQIHMYDFYCTKSSIYDLFRNLTQFLSHLITPPYQIPGR